MPLSKRVRVCWSLGKVNLMPCANAQGQAGALVIDEASRTSLQAEERAEQEELAHMMEEVLDAEEAAQEEGILCVCGVCGLCACVRVGMYGYHIAAFIKTLAPFVCVRARLTLVVIAARAFNVFFTYACK